MNKTSEAQVRAALELAIEVLEMRNPQEANYFNKKCDEALQVCKAALENELPGSSEPLSDDEIHKRLAEKDLEIMRLREVLERLAKLGNGDRYGNSEGNEIAKQALSNPTTYDDLMAWHEAQLGEPVAYYYDKDKSAFLLWQEGAEVTVKGCLDFSRAIERAHGIGE